MDTVWDAAVKSIGEDFYTITNISKDSRIITLTFKAKDPSEYIDCGKLTVTNTGGAGDSTVDVILAKAYSEYTSNCMGEPGKNTRQTALEVKTNIIFSETGKNQIRVIVNAQYIHTVNSRLWEVYGGECRNVTYSGPLDFVTGETWQRDDIQNGMLCTSKYTLERRILDRIRTKLLTK